MGAGYKFFYRIESFFEYKNNAKMQKSSKGWVARMASAEIHAGEM
jgi:hypothetical protein